MPTARGKQTPGAVCISSQERDAPLRPSRQQTMACAARRAHEVLFVESGRFMARHLWRFLRGPKRRSTVRRLLAGARLAPRIRVTRLLNVLRFMQRYRWNWVLGGSLVWSLLHSRARWIFDPRGVDATGSFYERFSVYESMDELNAAEPLG